MVDSAEALLSRFLVPLATFWICKPTPSLLAKLPECYSGNGYVEEGLLAAPAKRCTVRHCDRTGSTIVIFA